MLIEGSHHVPQAREEVFAALADPAVLARSLPGCRELVEAGEAAYDLTIDAGVGSIKGTYSGRVSIDEQTPPERYAATLDARGPTGSVRARLSTTLDARDGGTAIAYRVDADLTGAIAGVGQRVAVGVARRNAAAFFTALERELGADGAAAAAPDTASFPALGETPGTAPTRYPGASVPASGVEVRWLERGFAFGFLTTAGGVLLGAWLQRRRGRRR